MSIKILLHRILLSEIQRQNLIHLGLCNAVHQGLENIVSEYESDIISFLKSNLIDRWIYHSGSDCPENLTNINLQIILTVFIKQELDRRDKEILQTLYEYSYDIYDRFRPQFEIDNLLYTIEIHPDIETNQNNIIGCTLVEIDNECAYQYRATRMDIQNFENINKKVQGKMEELGILRTDETVGLYTIDYVP